MMLRDLLGDGPDVVITSLTFDNRLVGPGTLFFCVPGFTRDGHDFAPDAVARGAAALVVERELPVASPQIVVADAAEALGVLSARIAGRPTDRMTMIGITGTNGKTTTTYLIESILAAAGASPGVVGTVNYRFAGRSSPATLTTPPAGELQRIFAEMVAAGTSHAVMEVSSAALAMGRLGGIRFQVAAFTNLTQDHLDVHASMAEYQQAKQLLFARYLAAGGFAIVNVDDPAGAAMAAAARGARVVTVSTRGEAEVRATRFESTIEGIRAEIATPRGTLEVESGVLLGHYNVDNLVMAVAIGEALGLSHDRIAAGVCALEGVPGRVERVPNDAGLDVLVDYAHTPDALSNVLAALRPVTRRRLICVFGCGGDRDPGKRPKMGAAVADGADLAVVTSDNPRTEDPRAIIDMILPAVPDPFAVEPDRRAAIRIAVAEAVPGDVVLIAGKGHEDYQILGTTKIHFDDREEAAEAVRLRQTFELEDVLREGSARVVRPGRAMRFSRLVIDGRTAAPGDLYVAIRGASHDGHDFLGQAVAAGATGVVVAEDRIGSGIPDLGSTTVVAVRDPRELFGAVARFHRRRWGKKIVAVTGSTGKTTTKDLTAAALSSAGRVHRNAGSLNNETGVPLTLFGLRAHHDLAVVEMGMRGLGQIAELCAIAEPDVGVVVNAGIAHVGVVGSVEAIARGKGEIFHRLPPDGCAVLPAGDPRLAREAEGAPRRITFGEEPGAGVRLIGYRPLPENIESELELEVGGRVYATRLALIGKHVALDAACAVAAALALGVDAEAAAGGLRSARPPRLRGETVRVAGRNLLVDCYNANPVSMAAALDALADLRGGGRGRALAVLGDMLELGDETPKAHRETGRRAAELGIAVVALGDQRAEVLAGVQDAGGTGWSAEDPDAAAHLVLSETAPGDWILIKASRGMRLERVVDAVRAAIVGQGAT